MPETGDGKGGIALEKVGDFDAPLYVTQPADDGDDIYVVEQAGTIERVTPSGDQRTFLDISDEIVSGGEQGLLSMAFAPDYSKTGRFYVDYTNTDGDTRVVEYTAKDGVVDESSARELLAVDQPYPNHNGGLVLFGPDGDLYIGLGDGGDGGDPERRGLDLSTLLGKILRIDPAPDGSSPYTVPDDNPFVDRQGARPEIYSYGLRNPWRFSFDRETDDLTIGDVGQDAEEEIDVVGRGEGSGANFGWSAYEGESTLQRRPERSRRDPAGARRPALRRQLLDHRRTGGARPGPGLPLRALPLRRSVRRSAAQLHAAARSARGGRHGARNRRRTARQLRRGCRRHGLRGLDLGPRLPTGARSLTLR